MMALRAAGLWPAFDLVVGSLWNIAYRRITA